MTREELLELGLTQEQAEAVLEDAKQTEVEIERLQAQLDLRDRRDAVLAALPRHKPIDPQLVAELIDLNHLDGDGLEEQIEALKKRAPYLFADAPDPAGGTAASGMNAPEFDMNAFLRGEN